MKLMRKSLLLFICFLTVSLYAQEGITFDIEKLSPPERHLPLTSQRVLFERLILSHSNRSDKNPDIFPFNIFATTEMPDSLVSAFGTHPFFNGMYSAYADHRPFVLSPDMMWLLISQGFARHINANPEKFRPHITDNPDKISLIALMNSDQNEYDREAWEAVFPQFSDKIGSYMGPELITLLTADFSTTTITEKVASQITIMEAVKPYFEYVVIWIVCGIPTITLEGTTKDWEDVLKRTQQLGAYEQFEISWWTDELIPLLKEFVKASKGKVDKVFWRNMFKYHSAEKYGAPKIIDGWIVKFFPYDKYGKRNELKELHGGNDLPDEIVKVDLLYIKQLPSGEIKEQNLEIWAGFMGLEQDYKTYTLRPRIGWMVREKENRSEDLANALANQNNEWGIEIRVSEVPEEVILLGTVEKLSITFIDGIRIPDHMATMNIKELTLKGKTDPEEIKRILNLFPDVILYINGKSREDLLNLLK